LNRPLQEDERSAIRPLVTRRRDREPVAYILGHRDFFGRRFEVTRDVLIPRPDTETLVEHALAQIPVESASRVLDVGTGSGAIAITLAAERPDAMVTATDISEPALEVAARNAATHGVEDRIVFSHVDLVGDGASYDVVVSNPPYIATTEVETLEDEVRVHEPGTALYAGQDGLDVVRRLLDVARLVTQPGAHLLIEVGAGQAALAVDIGTELGGWERPSVYLDLDRIERVVHLRRS
jgi:release factor glutamine methyltransferase